MEAWGSDVCLRSHFLPFWRLRQAYSPSRPTFLLIVPAPTMTHFNPISLTGSGTLPDALPPKQPFWDRPGILADVAQVKSSLSTAPRHSWLLFWLLHLHIVETGFRQCQYRHVG